LVPEDLIAQRQAFGCDKDPRCIRFNEIQQDSCAFVETAAELSHTTAKNIFNDKSLFLLQALDLAACGWPCVTISAMSFYAASSASGRKPRKKSCIGHKEGETGVGFADFEGFLGHHPPIGFIGETVPSLPT
jgi:hypothetical protein